MYTRDVKLSFPNNNIEKLTFWIFTLYVTVLTGFQENDPYKLSQLVCKTQVKTVMASTRITACACTEASSTPLVPRLSHCTCTETSSTPTFPETKTSRWTRSKYSVRVYSAQCIKHAQIFSQNTFFLLLLVHAGLFRCFRSPYKRGRRNYYHDLEHSNPNPRQSTKLWHGLQDL